MGVVAIEAVHISLEREDAIVGARRASNALLGVFLCALVRFVLPIARAGLGGAQNMALMGGGLKGMAYIGALARLAAAGWDYTATYGRPATIAGASIGAFVGLLIALGYRSWEMLDLTRTLSDSSFWTPVPIASALGLMLMEQRTGIDDGSALRATLRSLIAAKMHGRGDATLADIAQATGVRLIVVQTDLGAVQPVYVTPESARNTPAAEVVATSMSLPFVFAPTVDTEHGRLLIDGGVLDNFPIAMFPADGRTLGLALESEMAPPPPNFSHASFTTIVTRFLSVIIHAWTRCEFAAVPAAHRARTVVLPVGAVPSFSPSETKPQWPSIIASGWKAVDARIMGAGAVCVAARA